jgi:hypothetical protein
MLMEKVSQLKIAHSSSNLIAMEVGEINMVITTTQMVSQILNLKMQN